MNQTIMDFINKYSKAIDDNQWQLIYDSDDYNALNAGDCGEFTYLVNKAGINPLYYMLYVPDYYMFAAKITEIELPNTITHIYNCAFRECSMLKTVTIPETVREIHDYAFANCDQLEKIIYKGTKAEWLTTIKDEDWDYNTDNYIVQCVDGDIKNDA